MNSYKRGTLVASFHWTMKQARTDQLYMKGTK